MGIYAVPALYDWFVAEYPKHAKYKLDMGVASGLKNQRTFLMS
jgi:hypothetical protein